VEYRVYYKRKLPHFQPRDGCFFITIRLAFAIPEKYLRAIVQYREILIRKHEQDIDQCKAKEMIKKLDFAYKDGIYDRCLHEVNLCDERVAKHIIEQLLAMHKIQYHMMAYTLMPNHLHLLIRPLENEHGTICISDIVRIFKGISARVINKELSRTGTLWFREYYDHWVRNQQELVNVIEYMRNNPVKAGLVKCPEDWQFGWVNDNFWEKE